MCTHTRAVALVALILAAAVPLAAQPVPLAPPPIEATSGEVIGSDAASIGNVYLVAWTEVRNGVAQVRAVHVAPNGTPVEPASFLISASTPASGVSAPAVVTNGGAFLVVWTAGGQLRTAIVPPAGAPQRVVEGPRFGESVSAAWNGTAYIVFGTDRATRTARAAILNTSGAVDRFVDLPVLALDPIIASDGRGHTIGVWFDLLDGDLHYAELTIGGAFVATFVPRALQSPPRALERAAIASDGSNFLVAWTVAAGSGFNVATRVIDASGNFAGPVQIVGTISGPMVDPFIYWNGSRYILVHAIAGNPALMAWRLKTDGTLDVGPRVVTPGSNSPKAGDRIVSGVDDLGNAHTLIVFRDRRFGHAVVFGQEITPNADPASTNEIVISRSPAQQHATAAVRTGNDVLVIYTESGGVMRVMGVRASDDNPFVIAALAPGHVMRDPSAATANGRTVVVWNDIAAAGASTSTINRAVISGSARQPDSIAAISTDASLDAPTVAAGPNTFAVSWINALGDVVAVLLDRNGNPLGNAQTMVSRSSDPSTVRYSSPKLAVAGSFYVLYWLREVSDGRVLVEEIVLSADSLNPAPFPATGAPVPPPPFVVALTTTGVASDLSVAGSTTGSMAAWVQRDGGTVDVRRTQNLANSRSRTAVRVIATGTPAAAPVVAWNGSSWEVAIGDRVTTIVSGTGAILASRTVPAIGRISAMSSESRVFVVGDVTDAQLDVHIAGELLPPAVPKPRAVRK